MRTYLPDVCEIVNFSLDMMSWCCYFGSNEEQRAAVPSDEDIGKTMFHRLQQSSVANRFM